MNKSQEDALDKINQLLSEHFEHSVICVGFKNEDDKTTGFEINYSGGWIPARGLLEHGIDKLKIFNNETPSL
jgi:hypothetical protein